MVSSSICDPSPEAGWGLLRVRPARLGAPGCGWGAAVVSAAAVLVLVALGLALSLLLQREWLLLQGGNVILMIPMVQGLPWLRSLTCNLVSPA